MNRIRKIWGLNYEYYYLQITNNSIGTKLAKFNDIFLADIFRCTGRNRKYVNITEKYLEWCGGWMKSRWRLQSALGHNCTVRRRWSVYTLRIDDLLIFDQTGFSPGTVAGNVMFVGHWCNTCQSDAEACLYFLRLAPLWRTVCFTLYYTSTLSSPPCALYAEWCDTEYQQVDLCWLFLLFFSHRRDRLWP